jgi:hypothetical protein
MRKNIKNNSEFTLKNLEDAIKEAKEYFNIDSNEISITFWINGQYFKIHHIGMFHIIPEITVAIVQQDK